MERLEGRDPFRCDQTNVFQMIGKDKFVELSTVNLISTVPPLPPQVFYNKVYNSENEAMKNMFVTNTPDINEAIQNQYEVCLLPVTLRG